MRSRKHLLFLDIPFIFNVLPSIYSLKTNNILYIYKHSLLSINVIPLSPSTVVIITGEEHQTARSPSKSAS